MREVLLLSIVVLLSGQGLISCLRIKDFRVPGHVAEGSEAVLGCKFDLRDQRLYAVKWLKDEREFYRYMPGINHKSVPLKQVFPERGISVDLVRSSMNWVTLVFMSRESAGEYSCEVTGEGPDFKKAVLKKNISVDLLPDAGPQVTGFREYYKVNEPVELNCTSAGARPESQVKWFINDAPAPPYHVYGPWYTKSTHRLDATDTTLELQFGLQFWHFEQGVMTLKCQAILPPLYQKEVVLRYQLLHRFRQGKLIDTTTQHYIKTTEEPCISTIKIQVEESPNHFEPWSVKPEKSPDGAGLTRNSAVMLFYCILLNTLL